MLLRSFVPTALTAVTLPARRETQGPQGLVGAASGISLGPTGELEQSRHEVVVLVPRFDGFTVAVSDRSGF